METRLIVLAILGAIIFPGIVHAAEIDTFVKIDTSLQYLVDKDIDVYYGDTIRVLPEGGNTPIYSIKYDYVGSPNYHKLTITKLGLTATETKYFRENKDGGEKFEIFGGDTIEGQFDNYETLFPGDDDRTEILYMKLKMSEATVAQFKAYFATRDLTMNPTLKEMEFFASQGGTALQSDATTKRFTLQETTTPIKLRITNVNGEKIVFGTQTGLTLNAVEIITTGTPTANQLSATLITDTTQADISALSAVTATSCTPGGKKNECEITITKIEGKEIKDLDFSNGLTISIARESAGKFSSVHERTLTFVAPGLYVEASQGIAATFTQLRRIGTDDMFELQSNEAINIVFQGGKKTADKYVVLGSINFTDFPAAARSAKTITDGKINTGELYKVTDTFTINQVGGKNIQAEEGFTLTYYVNLDDSPELGANEQKTITFQPKKSIDVQFTYANGTPIKKSDEEPNEYLIENDGKIQIKITGLKEEKAGNMATARLVNEYDSGSESLEDYIDLRSIVSTPTVDPQGYNLGENTLPLLIEREYCKRSTAQSATYECTLLIKTIEEKPITKQSEFGIVIYYDNDGDEKYESEETSTYTFKPATPTCTTLLECLAQLDKTITSKYLD